MERVVFESTDHTERFGTDSFEEVLELNRRPIIDRRRELQESIQAMSSEVATEDIRKGQLPTQRTDLAVLKKQIETARANLVKLVPKGQKEHAEILGRLESARAATEAKVENLRRTRRELDDLAGEVAHIRKSREPARFADMRRRFAGTAGEPLVGADQRRVLTAALSLFNSPAATDYSASLSTPRMKTFRTPLMRGLLTKNEESTINLAKNT